MAHESATTLTTKLSPETPTISVIIPAFNAAEYIGEALDSVFAQTTAPHEVIVINDGSRDTEELEQVLKRYPASLHYIKQENRGAAAARNAGLRAATGEFVAFLDGDDKWLPVFLEKQLKLLNRSKADLVYADALLVGESPLADFTFMKLQPSRGDVTAEKLLTVEVAILTSTVLARKEPIFKVGLFDETLRRGHDFELWLRLAKLGIKFAYQREVLAHYRIVETGLSGGTISQLERTLAVLEAIKSRSALTPSEDAALEVTLKRTHHHLALENGKQKLLEKDFDSALGFFNEAKKLRQNWKVVLVCWGLRIAPDILWRIYNRREMTPRGAASS